MEGVKKEEIKEISEDKGIVTVKYEVETEISVEEVKRKWTFLKDQESSMNKEKEKLKEIAKQANITLN